MAMDGDVDLRLDEVFKALSHPLRRKILLELSSGRKTYSELMKRLSVDSATVSFHLRALGPLVERDERGGYKITKLGRAAASLLSALDEREELEVYRRVLDGLAAVFAIIGLTLLSACSALDYPLPRLSFDLGLAFLLLPLLINRRLLILRRRSWKVNLLILAGSMAYFLLVIPAIASAIFGP